jgi:hypothetical protein
MLLASLQARRRMSLAILRAALLLLAVIGALILRSSARRRRHQRRGAAKGGSSSPAFLTPHSDSNASKPYTQMYASLGEPASLQAQGMPLSSSAACNHRASLSSEQGAASHRGSRELIIQALASSSAHSSGSQSGAARGARGGEAASRSDPASASSGAASAGLTGGPTSQNSSAWLRVHSSQAGSDQVAALKVEDADQVQGVLHEQELEVHSMLGKGGFGTVYYGASQPLSCMFHARAPHIVSIAVHFR